MKYGLVLAGGGVRGAFQIGVWKALREMNIELCAAVGTSIGAVNGALIAQGEYETAMKLWRGISLEDIIALPQNIGDKRNIFTWKNLAEIAKEIYSHEGLDMSPMESLLRGIIDEDKLRKSPMDFGIAAFSLTDKKGIYKFRDEIPHGSLVDFIMASASILTAKTIKTEKFSDGGMYDNMPVNMLLGRGVKNIITIDVQGIGINRGFVMAGRNIINIRSKAPQTGIMEFDSGGIGRSIAEGYLACMKALGRTAGEIYSFPIQDYIKAHERYSNEIISGIEKAAKIFDISALETYTFDGLCQRVMEEYYKQSQRGTADLLGAGFDRIRKDGDNALTIWLIRAIESGRNDFLTDKLAVLGDSFDAASAILYFKN